MRISKYIRSTIDGLLSKSHQISVILANIKTETHSKSRNQQQETGSFTVNVNQQN